MFFPDRVGSISDLDGTGIRVNVDKRGWGRTEFSKKSPFQFVYNDSSKGETRVIKSYKKGRKHYISFGFVEMTPESPRYFTVEKQP